MYKSAIIGGTGMENLSPEYTVTARIVETRFGPASVKTIESGRAGYVFLSRHGEDHGIPPHRINYRANIQALADLGVERVFASNAVGSLRLDLPPDSLVIIDDFLDFTRVREPTILDGSGAPHTDFSEPYCPELRNLLIQASADLDIPILPRGVYACAEGPRFESPAEVRMFAQLGGDIVGMTGIPESIFAREVGICYASIAIVTNFAAGLTDVPVDHADVSARMAVNVDKVRELFVRAVETVPMRGACRCGSRG